MISFRNIFFIRSIGILFSLIPSFYLFSCICTQILFYFVEIDLIFLINLLSLLIQIILIYNSDMGIENYNQQ